MLCAGLPLLAGSGTKPFDGCVERVEYPGGGRCTFAWLGVLVFIFEAWSGRCGIVSRPRYLSGLGLVKNGLVTGAPFENLLALRGVIVTGLFFCHPS